MAVVALLRFMSGTSWTGLNPIFKRLLKSSAPHKRMSDHLERTMPEVVTTVLDDGCIAISVGDFTGVVSSMHLIEPKAHQLQSAWLAREAELSDAR